MNSLQSLLDRKLNYAIEPLAQLKVDMQSGMEYVYPQGQLLGSNKSRLFPCTAFPVHLPYHTIQAA